ncbi:Ger(x)C family spore germination protein [Clostridium estertheticum]|uniref:Ger(x)C family spore germination protein n=1 Tax=Clostridium estertheticum TaxID=238834 RepID=UPI0013E97F46|nr:Ger(x)C family spore germination protein [Clostridium estertheticum]MBZ9686751.1 Ger(x)C family spore germination protein [Clostridium estertheticum]
MIKKFSILLIILMTIITLAGCWDFEDANKKSFILSVGVDKIDENVEITGEATAFVALRGGGEAQAQRSPQSFFQYSGIGNDIESARANIEQEVTQTFFLGETRVVVFGKSYAENGIASYLSRIDSTYDYRKNLIVVISREPAKKILSYPGNRKLGTGFYIEDNIKILTKNSAAIYTKIMDMISYKNIEGVGFFIPYIGIEKEGIRYLGLGVMKNFKLVDFIKVKDTTGILYLLNEKPILTESISLNDNKNKSIFKVFAKKRNIKTDYKNDKVIINIDLNLDASLQYQYDMKPISDENKKELQNKISENVKKDILENIDRSQNDYACDTFGFMNYFRAQNPKIYKTINWKHKYTSAEVNVNINTKIINTNLKDTKAKSK